MAQNSDALQEPSMDELLASIREIIEENAGAPPQEAGFHPPESGRDASRAAQARGAQSGYDAAMPNLKQDIRVDGGAPIQAGGYQNSQGHGSAYPGGGHNGSAGGYPPNGGEMNFAPGGRGAFPSFPGGNNGRGAPAFGNNGAGRGGEIRPEAEPRNGQDARGQERGGQDFRSGQGFPMREAPAQDLPVQDSMNALAERIGLRGNTAPQRGDGRINGPNKQAEAPAAPLPPFMMPQSSGAPAFNGQGAAPHAAAGGRPQNAPPLPQSRFNPAAMGAGFRGRDAAGDERAEKARFAEAQQARQKLAESKNGFGRAMASALGGRGAFDSAAMAELEKGLPSDVEHSTENLLRPFIAQWLDEHFRSLFEKVLREEVQRFIQSMRRS